MFPGESDPQSQARLASFSQILRQIGWVEGKTIVFEERFSDGDPVRLPALAAELVQAKVDVIVTQAAEPIEALHHATATIPIVMASAGDALGAGYITSLAHPGGNITGLTLVATEQGTKRLLYTQFASYRAQHSRSNNIANGASESPIVRWRSPAQPPE